MAQVKNLKIGNTSYGITDANTLPALTAAQRTTLLSSGKYLGSAVNNNTVFERHDGTFEKFNITSVTNFVSKSLNSSNNWRCSAYGNGTFVVSSIGTESYPLEYSTDGGNTWHKSNPSASGLTMYANWYMCYGNGMFVTVRGPTSDIGYSTDGITWSRRIALSPSSINWSSVAYGGDRFAFCAEGSGIINLLDKNLTVSSRVSLTVPYSGSAPVFSCVCYGNGKFVFVDKSDRAWYIADNSTQAVAVSMPASRSWHRTAYGNGVFVAIAMNSSAGAYSYDGITWTEMTMPRSLVWDGITWDGSKFIAIASGSSYYATSTDGITWTEATLPTSTTWESVVSDGNGVIVLVGSNRSTVYTSSGVEYSTTALSYNKTQTDSLLATKQGTLTAGANITISSENVISASGGSAAVIEVTGESGTLTSEQLAQISEGCIINCDGVLFKMSNTESTLTYKTFTSADVNSSDTMEFNAIYVQLDPVAVNYGAWTKEAVPVGGGGSDPSYDPSTRTITL